MSDDTEFERYRGPKPIGSMEAAARWLPHCAAYFIDFGEGIYDENAYLQVILPTSEAHVSADEVDDLVIGFAGVDGIYFCYRAGMAGIWAYYPIERRHVKMGDDLRAFIAASRRGDVLL